MENKELKRNDIARAAKELFADFGFKSVSMEQIAMRANVAKGTLYLYFKDKEDLINFLVKDFLKDAKAFVESVESKKLSFFTEIHEIVYNLLMYRRSQKFIFMIAKEAKEFKTPAACNVLKVIDNEIAGYIEKKLKAGIEQGIIKPCNPSILSFVVIKVYTALAFEWEESHEPLNEQQIAESVSLFLTKGLIKDQSL